MQTFRAYRTFEQDKVVSSRFVDLSLDDLDPGDVVIRTKYSTINYKDALSYGGAGKIMRKFPTVAGIDMAGIINPPLYHRALSIVPISIEKNEIDPDEIKTRIMCAQEHIYVMC